MSSHCLSKQNPTKDGVDILDEDDHLSAMDVEGYLKGKENPWRVCKADVKANPQMKLDYPEHYLAQYPDIFSEEGFDKLPPRRPWDHCIELNADFTPSNCKIYSLTHDEQKALDEFLEENLHMEHI